MEANYHADHGKNEGTFKRGEFLTTYNEIINGVSYYENRKHIVPSIKQIRLILRWMQAQGMIIVQPIIKKKHRLTGADSRAETRAYLGIKITVVNYLTYQDLTNYKGRDKGRPNSPQGQIKEKNKRKKEETSSLSSLCSRYPDQDLLDQVFKAIASTRKTNQVAESVLVAFLQKCERYSIQQVEAGMRVYVEKDCAGQGKKEEYLLGIIRNQKTGEPKQETTGSPALDAYYARNHQ